MEEIWKDIVGYEGKFQVSNFGRAKNINYKNTGKEHIIPLHKTQDGYLEVSFTSSFSSLIHRLVALYFIPIPEHLKNIPIEKLDVGHLKTMPNGLEDKTANEVWNISWMSRGENQLYGTLPQRRSQSLKGKHHSEETKNKIRTGCINNPSKTKPVLQIDIITNEVIKEWSSAAEVERELGFGQAHISACCHGRCNSAYGYKWSFK